METIRSGCGPMWALQVVNALPYPLASRTEWFVTSDYRGRGSINVEGLVRNKALVVIPSDVRRLVLVLPQGMRRASIGGHPIQIQGIGDRGEMPDLVGHDARDLIVESLRLLLTHSGSLTTLLDVWASERVSGGKVD